MNEYKINFSAKIRFRCRAEMVPGERSKSSGVTKPERAAEAFFSLNKTFDNLPK